MCAVAHGSADLELVLPMHCKALGILVPACLQKYVDLRLAAQRYASTKSLTGSKVSSLKQICDSLGVEMMGNEHCGLDDAWMVLLAMQELLKNNAELRMIDIVSEQRQFVEKQEEKRLCIDGVPFMAVRSDLDSWLSHHSLEALVDDIQVVLGLDARPGGRALLSAVSHEAALKILKVFEGGSLLVCDDGFGDPTERLLLVRPPRIEELDLASWEEIPSYSLKKSGPALAPFPRDRMALKRQGPSRGVCFSFQKGDCNNGSSCRYLHEIASGRSDMKPCVNFFQKGRCSHGSSCRYSHDSSALKQPIEDLDQRICVAFQRGNCSRGSWCRSLHQR